MVLLILVIFVAISVLYVNSVKNLLFLEADTHLKEIAVQSSKRIEEKINSNLELLGTLEAGIHDFKGYSDEGKMSTLSKWCDENSFSQMGYADSLGRACNSDGKYINISEKSYFKEAVAGKNYVSDVIRASGKISGNSIILAVPIIENGSVQGVLYGLLEAKHISDIINFDFFGGRGYEYILDRNGNIIVHPEIKYINNNIFYELSKYNNSIEVQKFKSGFLKSESGGGIYLTDKGKKYVSYVPVRVNNQKVNLSAVTVASYDVVFKYSKKIVYETVGITIMLCIVFAGVMAYILEQKRKNERNLKKAAYEDDLCKVLNRNGFIKEATDCHPKNNLRLAAVYMDIDNFKIINSIFGYEFGDRVLRYMADILTARFNEGAVVGRLDADNFCILVQYENQEEIFGAIKKVIDGINNKYSQYKEITLSAGIYFMEDKEEAIDQILDKAQLANENIKSFKKESYAIYDDELTKIIKEENWLIEELKKAIGRKAFEVYYQPKFELESEAIVGSEALIRWKHDSRGFISPMEFIPLAEKTHLIVDIGRYVFEKVCKDMQDWKKRGIYLLQVSVNVSRVELYQADIVDFLKNTVEKYEVDYNLIQIEITETLAMDEYENIKKVLSKIDDLGISISIDDFGSGYSSLGCLQKFKVDTLKLDRSFLVNIESDKKGINILRGMVELSRELGLKTICEGIETKEQLEMLKAINCKYGQGFIFARPMPKAEYEEFAVQNINKQIKAKTD